MHVKHHPREGGCSLTLILVEFLHPNIRKQKTRLPEECIDGEEGGSHDLGTPILDDRKRVQGIGGSREEETGGMPQDDPEHGEESHAMEGPDIARFIAAFGIEDSDNVGVN